MFDYKKPPYENESWDMFLVRKIREEKGITKMTNWCVSTSRKDCIEQQVWTKGDSTVKYSTGWRWVSWDVVTTDNNEPDFESDEDGLIEFSYAKGSNIESCEFVESNDGCWDEWDFSDDIDDGERERIQEGWEEETYDFMYEDGWVESDTYWYAHKDSLDIKKTD